MLKLTELNSNIIFLFPIIMGALWKEPVFFTLSLLMCIASFLFHIHKSRQSPKTEIFRSIDIIAAVVSYFYLFYFVSFRVAADHAPYYVALFATLILFFIGKRRDNDPTIHAYFHIFIGLTAGSMVFFAN